MNIVVSHVYRKDNTCANALANISLNLNSFIIIPFQWMLGVIMVKIDLVDLILGSLTFENVLI